MSRSFVDVLFILLCGMIVLLSQSFRIGALEVDPPTLGSGGIDRLTVEDIQVVVVDENRLFMDDQPFEDASACLMNGDAMLGALLVPRHDAISYHRMMEIYDVLSEAGVDTRFGVETLTSQVSIEENP